MSEHEVLPKTQPVLARKAKPDVFTHHGGDGESVQKTNLEAKPPRDLRQHTFPHSHNTLERVIHSSGQMLDAGTRTFMESRFGQDFSSVRIHADPGAAASAQSLHATAFTLGEHVVFDNGKYSPETAAGRQLLAHELAHVTQQKHARGDADARVPISSPTEPLETEAQAAATRVTSGVATAPALRNAPRHVARQMGDVQLAEAGRAPIVRERFEIPHFEFTGSEQKPSTEVRGGHVDLAYYPDTGMFLCTFRMRWELDSSGLNEKERAQFKMKLMQAVRARWNNRYKLVEYAGEGTTARATGRTASVQIGFTEPDIERFATAAEARERLSSLPYEVSRSREAMTTARVDPKVEREAVTGYGSEMELSPRSNNIVERNTSRYENYGEVDPDEGLDDENMQSYLTHTGQYSHYRRAGVEMEFPPNKVFKQRVSEHEFGHVLGLGDEYILSRKDYEKMGTTTPEFLHAELEKRHKATSSIMNIGSDVRPDHYRPFASWLSSLTHSDWRVAGD